MTNLEPPAQGLNSQGQGINPAVRGSGLKTTGLVTKSSKAKDLKTRNLKTGAQGEAPRV